MDTYLAIVLKPPGGDARDGVVFLLGAAGARERGLTARLHGLKEVGVGGLLQVAGLFCREER